MENTGGGSRDRIMAVLNVLQAMTALIGVSLGGMMEMLDGVFGQWVVVNPMVASADHENG